MSLADEIVARIDRDTLVQFALEICNIDSAVPFEAEVAERLYQWLKREGFIARRVGLLSDRFNVMGTLPGTGGGYSLIFNSHMDTAVSRQADFVHRDPANDIYHKAWVEGDLLVGEGICNDKGPMAAFLIAAKAIKDSGHKLKGDLLVSGVVGETSREPCDDPPGVVRESKELGARFLVTHGGVADYALVAEGCVYRKSDSAILVMKSAKDRSRCDDAEALNRARERSIFAQRAMNSRLVVIPGVGI